LVTHEPFTVLWRINPRSPLVRAVVGFVAGALSFRSPS